MCPLTLHALFHIPDDILNNGPCCYNWSFVMERWCGSLVIAVKSRHKPFVTLSLRLLHLAQLATIETSLATAGALNLYPPVRMRKEKRHRRECMRHALPILLTR